MYFLFYRKGFKMFLYKQIFFLLYTNIFSTLRAGNNNLQYVHDVSELESICLFMGITLVSWLNVSYHTDLKICFTLPQDLLFFVKGGKICISQFTRIL